MKRFLAPNAHLGWQQPRDLPATSFSHTGFTGTYVLGVPDAYELPRSPGHGYLKFGTEPLLRFKAAYVSGPMRKAGARG